MVLEESYRRWTWMSGESSEFFLFGSNRKMEDTTENFRPKKKKKKASEKLVQMVWKPGRTSSMFLGGPPPTPTTITLTTEVSESPPTPFLLLSTGLHLDPGHVIFPYTCNPSPASSAHRPHGHQHGPRGLETRALAYLTLTLQMNGGLPNTQTLLALRSFYLSP